MTVASTAATAGAATTSQRHLPRRRTVTLDVPFQAPFVPQLPLGNAALIAALAVLGVDAVWVNLQAGTPPMVDAYERVVATEDVELRFAGDTDRVAARIRHVSADE